MLRWFDLCALSGRPVLASQAWNLLRLICALLMFMFQPFSSSSSGAVVFEGMVFSPILQTNRMVRIYLPASYNASLDRRYPVIYLHDGQNAFSTVGPYVAFGWGNWEMDRTADRLAREGKMGEVIMVAIDCGRERYREYRGPSRTSPTSESGRDDAFRAYSRFLRGELKPKIDREYRTLTDARHTALIGSSMGGLCSLALAWEHPDVFGKAASLSGAFQVEQKYFLQQILAAYRGKPKPIQIYLDSGVVDYSGSDDGCKDTAAVAKELQRIGWRRGRDLVHYIDEHPLTSPELSGYHLSSGKENEARTSQHNEFYWRIRAWRPLTFLFPGGSH